MPNLRPIRVLFDFTCNYGSRGRERRWTTLIIPNSVASLLNEYEYVFSTGHWRDHLQLPLFVLRLALLLDLVQFYYFNKRDRGNLFRADIYSTYTHWILQTLFQYFVHCVLQTFVFLKMFSEMYKYSQSSFHVRLYRWMENIKMKEWNLSRHFFHLLNLAIACDSIWIFYTFCIYILVPLHFRRLLVIITTYIYFD